MTFATKPYVFFMSKKMKNLLLCFSLEMGRNTAKRQYNRKPHNGALADLWGNRNTRWVFCNGNPMM